MNGGTCRKTDGSKSSFSSRDKLKLRKVLSSLRPCCKVGTRLEEGGGPPS